MDLYHTDVEEDLDAKGQLIKAERALERLADVLRELYHNEDLAGFEAEVEDHFEALGLKL